MIIPMLLSRSIIGPVFRIFAVPGVIVHELGHVAMCLVTGTPIQRVRFFKKTGGEVVHESSKLPIIGSLLITFGPLLLGFVVIILLAKKVLVSSHINATGISLHDFMPFLIVVIKNIKWGSLATFVWLYLILSIGSTMTPSFQDFRNSLFSFIILLIGFGIIAKVPALLSFANSVAVIALPPLTIALFILLILALVSLFVYTISQFFGIK